MFAARLYIKKCSHCGLQYFGKTASKKIEKYNGSGTYWQRHLKKYGAKSVHIWNSEWYTNIEELKTDALSLLVDNAKEFCKEYGLGYAKFTQCAKNKVPYDNLKVEVYNGPNY